MLRLRWALSAAAALAACLLSACAIVDQFSPRAVEFNLQAEQAQQSNLLLNIIRASLRRPMQFTGLSSITGTASASGSLTGSYSSVKNTPLIRQFGLAPPAASTVIASAVTGAGGASASMSGGPTFTVPVLDTQEFYQGILQPLSAQEVDYYVKQGYHPQILFALFARNVEVISIPGCHRFSVRNDPRDVVQFSQFLALADYLIGSGFTTERITETRRFGPPIRTSDAARQAQLLEAYSKAAAAGLDIRSSGRDTSIKPGQRPTGLTVEKRSTRYRFCFSKGVGQDPAWLKIPPHAYCGQANAPGDPKTEATLLAQSSQCGLGGARGEQGASEGGRSRFIGIELHPRLLDRMDQIRRENPGYHSPENFFPTRLFQGRKVILQFNSRSVESIIYYLGEVTRQNLNLDGGEPRIVQVKTQLRFGMIPHSECAGATGHRKTDLIALAPSPWPRGGSYLCENLFMLDRGGEPGSFYSVTYDGVTYSIPSDPARAGRTLQVLELVKQLLALHTSAKNLPQAAVFSLIGGQ